MKIAYSQCWEDSEVVIKALKINAEDTVLSISSGGCNTLAIAGCLPEKVYSIDFNPAQNFLLELKTTAIQQLNQNDLPAFLGYQRCANRQLIFQTLLPYLSEDCKDYWVTNRKLIEKGVVHCGKFENYLRIFRQYILPLVHSKTTLKALVSPKNKSEQVEFYWNKWNSIRWKIHFKVFFNRLIMSGRGRSKQMFSHSKQIPVATVYANRVQKAFTEGVVTNNFYLNYLLFDTYNELPFYLLDSNNVRNKGLERINIVSKNLLSFLKKMPENSISKFNLSDVFEPITQHEMDNILLEIMRTAKPNARLIFWNNLVSRTIDSTKNDGFVRDTELEKELTAQDKVFFYDCFYIYQIQKA